MGKALGFAAVLGIVLIELFIAFFQLSTLNPAHPALFRTAMASSAPTAKKTATKAATAVRTHAAVVAPIKVTALQGANTAIADVPFFSQFADIASPQWQEVGCGITSLAMMIDFYKPNSVSVNDLLQQGVAAGAYDQNAGWNFAGLIQLGQQYGLNGNIIDLSKLKASTALVRLDNYLKSGPLILSIHNRFNPKNILPHLIVVNGIKNNVVYYNDPAAKTGQKKISVTNLLRGWEKKGIVFRADSAEKRLSLK